MLLLALIFAAPLVNGLITTFRNSSYGILGDQFTLGAWQYIIGSPAYRDTLIRTLLYAGTATILCIVIGFPVAYHIVFRSRFSSLLTLLVIVPLLLNAVVLGIGWIIILNSNGLVNSILQADLPDHGTIAAGCTHRGGDRGPHPRVHAVHDHLPDLRAARGLDTRVVQSAVSLGASPRRAFWDVTVPMCMPGILSGAVLAFTLSAGCLHHPRLPRWQPPRHPIAPRVRAGDHVALDCPLAIATALRAADRARDHHHAAHPPRRGRPLQGRRSAVPRSEAAIAARRIPGGRGIPTRSLVMLLVVVVFTGMFLPLIVIIGASFTALQRHRVPPAGSLVGTTSRRCSGRTS